MNLVTVLIAFILPLSTLAQSIEADDAGERKLLFQSHRGRARGKYGNSTSTITPRHRVRDVGVKRNRATKLDPCQKVVDFWTSDRIKSACTEPLHMSYDGGGDRNRNLREARDLQASVFDDPWVRGGDVLAASGRLLFRMSGRFSSCSATAVRDGSTTNGRSIIVTAAHCVFSSESKQFADYFMFIPNQDDGGSDTSDLNCNNDRFGCWTPSFAVVDDEWASRDWSNNIPWDYAFLVVDDVGNHRGPSGVSDVLDDAVPAMGISFRQPNYGEPAYGMGYSGNRDPDFRYCVQDLDHYSSRGGYILNGCGLTGGSSGGPWFQRLNRKGRGSVIAVNSYGPAGSRGYMGGPRLHDNSAECLFQMAKTIDGSAASGNGIIVSYDGDCSSATYVSGTQFNNGGGSGSCAQCSRYQDAYDQACCNAYGGNEYYARFVSSRGSIFCGRCS